MGGMTHEQAKQAAAEIDGQELVETVVLPAYLRNVVTLAQNCASQLRFIGGGMSPAIPLGFDYAAVNLVAGWLGIPIDKELFHDLRQIEVDGCAVLRS